MALDERELEFEISDDERESLEALMRQPGYPVLWKILDSYVRSLREGAQSVALTDPLNNGPKVLAAWSTASVAVGMRRSFEEGLKFEVAILRQRKNPRGEELASERRKQFTLEAVPRF